MFLNYCPVLSPIGLTTVSVFTLAFLFVLLL
jgi:hypothetical protein